ncbi:hypothetical protein ACFL2V_19065 [Pseudomonadota bacterium]
MYKRLTIFTLIIACFLLLFSVQALAANSLTPTGNNLLANYEVQPGKIFEGELLLKNTDEEKTFQVYAADSIRNNSGNLTAKPVWDEQIGPGLWTKFTQSTYTLEKTQEIINFQIEVPEDIIPGTYPGYFALSEVKESKASSTKKAASNSMSTRKLQPFTIVVPGEKINELSLDSFSLLEEKDSYTFTFVLSNKGNTSIIAEPVLTIKDQFGIVFKEIKKDKITLFREEAVQESIRIDEKPFFGLFKAQLEVVYSENDTINNQKNHISTLELSISFQEIPIVPSIAASLLIFLLIGYIIFRKRNN